MSKPSDLIPELQGRFPLRVELEPLQAAEFEKILTQPQNALIKQYKALMATEDVNLEFTDDALPAQASLSARTPSPSHSANARFQAATARLWQERSMAERDVNSMGAPTIQSASS